MAAVCLGSAPLAFSVPHFSSSNHSEPHQRLLPSSNCGRLALSSLHPRPPPIEQRRPKLPPIPHWRLTNPDPFTHPAPSSFGFLGYPSTPPSSKGHTRHRRRHRPPYDTPCRPSVRRAASLRPLRLSASAAFDALRCCLPPSTELGYMSGTRPVLERQDYRYGGPAHPDIMSIQSVVDVPAGVRDEIAHSNWGYETPGGFFPRPYGKLSTTDRPARLPRR